MNFLDFCNQTGIRPSINHIAKAEQYVLYFLLRDLKIVYIGKSNYGGFGVRILAHKKDKEFTHYAIIKTGLNEDDCLRFESGLISFLRPEYNRADCYPDFNKAFFALQVLMNHNFESRISRLERGTERMGKVMLWFSNILYAGSIILGSILVNMFIELIKYGGGIDTIIYSAVILPLIFFLSMSAAKIRVVVAEWSSYE